MSARIAVVILCVGLSAIAVLPFFFLSQPLPGAGRWDLRMPETHDMFLHFDQMRDFYQGLAAGEIYPRWEEDTNYGFGAPTTCFYPPGVYYLTSALYPLLRDWTRVLAAAHLLMMLASGCAMYWLARRSMSRAAACVAMAVYILLPYHLTDQYQRGALAELMAFVWMPLMAGLADRLIETSRTPRSLTLAGCLAAAYGAFLWSHVPTAYQFTLSFGVFVLVLAILQRSWRRLPWIAGAMTLGLGLSAAYLYPAAVEQRFIRHEIVSETWPYRETYLFTRPEYTHQFPHFFDLLDIAWLFSAAAIIAVAIAFFWLKTRNASLNTNFAAWLAVGCFASFLMLPIADGLESRIPKVDIGVYTWRMLAITGLVVAWMAGATVDRGLEARRERQKTRYLVFGLLSLAILASAAIITATGVVTPVHDSASFQPEKDHTNYAIIPTTAPEDTDDLPRVDRLQLQPASGSAAVLEWKPQHRVVEVKAPAAVRLFVRTFNYPGWRATLDAQPLPIGIDKEIGAMLLDVPAGDHRITLDFLDTPVRRLGKWITLASFLLCIAATAAGRLMS